MDGRDVEAYRRDGVVVLRGMVDAVTRDALARGLEANMAVPGPWANEYTPTASPGWFFDDYVNWARIPEYREAATRSSQRRCPGTTTTRTGSTGWTR